MAKFPEINKDAVLNGSFGEELENYINDHIFGRDAFVTLNAYFDLFMGRNTAKDIYFGKNGYLINAPADSDTSKFEKSIERFENFSASFDIPSYLLMVPTTGYIMRDMLPLGHRKYNDDMLFDKAYDLTEKIKIVDVREALTDAKEKEPVCYRTDHHLTAYGNYTAYAEYLRSVGRKPLKTDDFEIESFDGFCGTTWSGSGYSLVKGDDIELWHKDGDITVTILDAGEEEKVSDSLFFREHLNDLDKYPVYLDGNHSFVKIENRSAAGGTVLVIKDSYAQCFSTFLAHEYRNVYMIDMRYYRASISDFINTHDIDEILYMYGVSTLLTDTNSAWIM